MCAVLRVCYASVHFVPECLSSYPGTACARVISLSLSLTQSQFAKQKSSPEDDSSISLAVYVSMSPCLGVLSLRVLYPATVSAGRLSSSISSSISSSSNDDDEDTRRRHEAMPSGMHSETVFVSYKTLLLFSHSSTRSPAYMSTVTVHV